MKLAGHLKMIKDPFFYMGIEQQNDFKPDEPISESNALVSNQYRNEFLDKLINSFKSYFSESDTRKNLTCSFHLEFSKEESDLISCL